MIVINHQSLLLRFMDDYLCLSNTESNAAEFKENSIDRQKIYSISQVLDSSFARTKKIQLLERQVRRIKIQKHMEIRIKRTSLLLIILAISYFNRK